MKGLRDYIKKLISLFPVSFFYFHLDTIYKGINWSGEKVMIFYDDSHIFVELTRDELSEYLPVVSRCGEKKHR